MTFNSIWSHPIWLRVVFFQASSSILSSTLLCLYVTQIATLCESMQSSSPCMLIGVVDLSSNRQCYFILTIRRAHCTDTHRFWYIIWQFFVYRVCLVISSHWHTVISLSCTCLCSSRFCYLWCWRLKLNMQCVNYGKIVCLHWVAKWNISARKNLKY